MKFNNRELKILSIVAASWGIIFIGSGIYMEKNEKVNINTKYTLKISSNRIAETQAKKNEIKLKDFELEINTPLSVDVKDYLEDVENISESILQELKLDTSRVNINEAGDYQYTITYKKKKYLGNIKIKEKELPNVTLKLKNIVLNKGDALSTNPSSYIEGEVPEEVYNNLTLDLSGVQDQVPGSYKYYISYKNETYEGEITIKDPGPTIITPNTKEKEEIKEEEKTEEKED